MEPGARSGPVFIMKLRCGAHVLDLSVPRVMGILNITPDSFADGGANFDHATGARPRPADGG